MLTRVRSDKQIDEKELANLGNTLTIVPGELEKVVSLTDKVLQQACHEIGSLRQKRKTRRYKNVFEQRKQYKNTN